MVAIKCISVFIVGVSFVYMDRVTKLEVLVGLSGNIDVGYALLCCGLDTSRYANEIKESLGEAERIGLEWVIFMS